MPYKMNLKTLHLSIMITMGIIAIAILAFASSTVLESEPISNTPQSVQSMNNTNQSSSTVIPSITLSSDKVNAGSIIEISGQGFVQSVPVKITLPDDSVVDVISNSGTY